MVHDTTDPALDHKTVFYQAPLKITYDSEFKTMIYEGMVALLFGY